MSFRIFVCPREGAPAIRGAELRKTLTDESGLVCNGKSNDHEKRVVLGHHDVVIWLHVDEEGNPAAGVVEFSLNTDLRNVSSVCRAFKELGWELGDVPSWVLSSCQFAGFPANWRLPPCQSDAETR
ncbi:MAG: hypothetical protein H8E44_29550 [Planctomycetes bacterium]|nr:hypothetical protein [Planctomycetota bacterium]